MPALVWQWLYYPTVLCKVLYYEIQNVFFIFCVCFLYMYHLCEKHYKPITVHYDITKSVNWVPRLNLLDFRTSGTYKSTLRMKLIHLYGTYYTCFHGLTIYWCPTNFPISLVMSFGNERKRLAFIVSFVSNVWCYLTTRDTYFQNGVWGERNCLFHRIDLFGTGDTSVQQKHRLGYQVCGPRRLILLTTIKVFY